MKKLLFVILILISSLLYLQSEDCKEGIECEKSNFNLENLSIANPSIIIISEK